MTTVVFYKGVMVADTLQTKNNFVGSKSLDKVSSADFKFTLVQKIERITVNSKTHIIGLSGEVGTIVAFLDAFRKNELNNFIPKYHFRAIDFNNEKKMTVWYVNESFTLLNLIPFVNFPEYKLKTKNYNYDEKEEAAYIIGSGRDTAVEAYEKLKFQFNMLEEKIEDHLKPLEVAKYLVKVASLCDYHTNDKVCWSESKEDTFTPVSPQNANLSKG